MLHAQWVLKVPMTNPEIPKSWTPLDALHLTEILSPVESSNFCLVGSTLPLLDIEDSSFRQAQSSCTFSWDQVCHGLMSLPSLKDITLCSIIRKVLESTV